MVKLDVQNTAFMQAVSFVNHTNRNIFLTGKAGTGKTTFLHYIRQHSYKKMAIAAPTGVAAMNAGGMTLHSLFWLPFGMYIEDYELAWNQEDSHIYNRRRLFSKIKLTKQRRALLREIELLVIDEVSMLRADLLDAIDAILRSVRRDARAFGGLQLLFIGDMYQLPPVVKEREREIMQHYYPSPFFFDARVLQEHPPILLELKTIYRQRDQQFIDLLNNIRNNRCTAEQLAVLNDYCKPDFTADTSAPYIMLTTHNHRADAINQKELEALPGKPVQLKAVVKDDFGEGSFPVDETLTLKVGAQVMFVRNDSGESRKFYNGKIGFIQQIDEVEDVVTVGFKNGDEAVRVQREVWENIRYHYDSTTDVVHEELLGTFAQFPLRLAWAITIHKSQGLTFDRAVIDAGASFAAGQVYVALSRLRGLEGLVLHAPINTHSIHTDERVATFSSGVVPEDAVAGMLKTSQQQYLGHILLDGFKWDRLVESAAALHDGLTTRNIADPAQAQVFTHTMHAACGAQKAVADKFRNQLRTLLGDDTTLNQDAINERTTKAVNWFMPQLDERLIAPLEAHIRAWAVKKRTKRYIDDVTALLVEVKRKREQLLQCLNITGALAQGELLEEVMKKTDDFHSIAANVTELPDTAAKPKAAKGETRRISLALFKSGKTVPEIAAERSLTAGTVTQHLMHYIGNEITATDLMDGPKLTYIVETLQKNPGTSMGPLKALLGDEVTYTEIRIAMAHLQKRDNPE